MSVSVLKISFLAPTNSGKSTIAKYVCKRHGGNLLKIAQPLYDLQSHFYNRIGKDVTGQDGELLQFFGMKIEKEAPFWLCRNFLDQVSRCENQLVVNDDCRPNCYSALLAGGFKFIFVETSFAVRRARLRGDHTPIDPSHSVERGIDESLCEYRVCNDGNLAETYKQVDEIIDKLR